MVPFACVNSSSSPLGQQPFDGGDRFDSRVDYDGALPDGALPDLVQPPPPDGGDAADAAPTTATVTVLGTNALPKAGVAVVFQDATGAVVEAKTTDAFGRASRSVVDGSMVTVATGGSGRRELFTFLGIKNGAQILAFDVDIGSTAQPTFSVDVPLPLPVGTLSYSAQAGDCASAILGQGPVTVYLQQRCQNGGKSPIVAFGYDDGSNKSVWSFQKGNALATDGGVAQVTGLPAWSSTFGTFGITTTNAPAALQAVSFSTAETVGGVPLHSDSAGPVTGGTASVQMRMLPGYADAFQSQASVQTFAQLIGSWSFISKAVAPPASGATQAYDLAQLMPAFTGVTVDATDAAHPKMVWTSVAPFTGADGGFARIPWSARTDAGVSETNGWTFVFPASTTNLQGPQLPASLDAWVPPTGVGISAPVVAFVEEDDIPGYDALLTKYPSLSTLDANGAFIRAPLLPLGVTLRAAYAYNPG